MISYVVIDWVVLNPILYIDFFHTVNQFQCDLLVAQVHLSNTWPILAESLKMARYLTSLGSHLFTLVFIFITFVWSSREVHPSLQEAEFEEAKSHNVDGTTVSLPSLYKTVGN